MLISFQPPLSLSFCFCIHRLWFRQIHALIPVRINLRRCLVPGLGFHITASIGEGDEENSNLDLFSLEMFENIAYTMAKHADPQIPNEVDEWLDGFNTFSIYQVLPQLIELWGLNVKTDVEAIDCSHNYFILCRFHGSGFTLAKQYLYHSNQISFNDFTAFSHYQS